MFLFVIIAAGITRSPQIAEMRAVDVLLIFAAGVCFGSGLVGIILNRRERGGNPPN